MPVTAPLRVFIAGTFDGLHYAHVSLFKFARRAGEKLARKLGRNGVYLCVVIARDDSVLRIKGRPALHTQLERRDLVAAIRYVDEAFVGYRDNFVRSVRRARPDLIVLGYDQSSGWEEVLRRSGIVLPVLRCPAFKARRLKSSMLRDDLRARRT